MVSKHRDAAPDMFALAAQLQAHMEAAVAKAPSGQPPAVSSQPPAPGKPAVSNVQRMLAIARKRLRQSLKDVEPAAAEAPIVSIIILAFNKVSYTLRCLESLSHQVSHHTFEVILVDNNSTDKTRQLAGATPGLRYIHNSTNEGFVDGCNTGVKQARGKVIVLLNNDTQVLGNWLDPLVDRLMSDDTIGSVGSKLIYPDGRLQDAGGIIFNDASGYNFGKNKNADDFAYNFSREVDYCTGASVAFWRKDFLKIGGFDRRYAPAYYEDTDLGMSLRHKLGKRAMYEPHSIVVHVEGGTAGTDTGSGFKRYQAINREKFLKKWKKELAREHYPPTTNPLLAARHGKRKHMLIVDSIVPEHNRDSGSLRMFQIIKSALQLNYDVTFYADNRVATQPYTAELQSLGVEVVYGAGLTIQDFHRERAGMYDVIILSRPTTALWHLEYCKGYQPKARLIYDTLDLHYLRILRQAEAEKKPTLKAEAEKWRQLEYYLMDNTDATLVVSYEERDLLQKDKPGLTIYTVSNINPRPNIPAHNDFAKRQGLLFMADYKRAPNHTAARWFVTTILPLIRKELPDVRLTLLGSNPDSVQDLAGPDIDVTGFQENKDPYYHAARIFVCPLRYGAGVKGKVSESIAYGLPVVSTGIGIEGMHLKNEESCLVAEFPRDFAHAVVRLYNDPQLWQEISKNALATYDQYFSEAAGLKALQDALG